MTPIPVPQRWLAALLGAAFLIDIATSLRYGLGGGGLLLGAAAIAVCTYFAVDYPVPAALAGGGTLVLSSALFQDEAWPVWVGIDGMTLTEIVAGSVLVVLVIWHRSPLISTATTAALVVAALSALLLRHGPALVLRTGFAYSLAFGFLLLAGCVTVGVYLRRSNQSRMDTEVRALLRKQWPLTAALGLLILLDISASGFDPIGMVTGMVVGACAFLAPRAPARAALVAATAIILLSLLSGLTFATTTDLPLLAVVAGAMALVAYLVRYAQPDTAALCTTALVAANGFATVVRSGWHFPDINVLLTLSFLLIVSIVTGLYFRARDQERHQSVRSAVTSAQQGERMALARELHDVVAHHVTGIVVQAQAARLVADADPRVAVTALEKIEHSGTEALTAMRTLVGSLRDGTPPAGTATAAGQATTDLAADLQVLVDGFTGPPVRLDLELPDQLPHEVGRSVLRLVQESLTNVGKHAPDANEAVVRVAATDGELHLRVTDDGAPRRSTPPGGTGGYGLVGMRERVELLGGRFDAGPSGYVGWHVEAWLPLGQQGAPQ